MGENHISQPLKKGIAETCVATGTMLEELERNLPIEVGCAEKRNASSSKENILEVLARAADDHKFLARLAENPSKVLQEFDLSQEERSALARGDIEQIEAWVGKLNEHLKTWLIVRQAQDKW